MGWDPSEGDPVLQPIPAGHVVDLTEQILPRGAARVLYSLYHRLTVGKNSHRPRADSSSSEPEGDL
jgi:hypothetical protein